MLRRNRLKKQPEKKAAAKPVKPVKRPVAKPGAQAKKPLPRPAGKAASAARKPAPKPPVKAPALKKPLPKPHARAAVGGKKPATKPAPKPVVAVRKPAAKPVARPVKERKQPSATPQKKAAKPAATVKRQPTQAAAAVAKNVVSSVMLKELAERAQNDDSKISQEAFMIFLSENNLLTRKKEITAHLDSLNIRILKKKSTLSLEKLGEYNLFRENFQKELKAILKRVKKGLGIIETAAINYIFGGEETVRKNQKFIKHFLKENEIKPVKAPGQESGQGRAASGPRSSAIRCGNTCARWAASTCCRATRRSASPARSSAAKKR